MSASCSPTRKFASSPLATRVLCHPGTLTHRPSVTQFILSDCVHAPPVRPQSASRCVPTTAFPAIRIRAARLTLSRLSAVAPPPRPIFLKSKRRRWTGRFRRILLSDDGLRGSPAARCPVGGGPPPRGGHGVLKFRFGPRFSSSSSRM